MTVGGPDALRLARHRPGSCGQSSSCSARPQTHLRIEKTPVLAAPEARQLIDSIDIKTVVSLRDRALIGLLVFIFARIGAALGMTVADVYWQHRCLWVRLHEKGGKQHNMPCYHHPENYL
jgi:integrase